VGAIVPLGCMGTELMPQDRPVGVVTGLVFVALFLLMLATMHSVAGFVRPPTGSYELAGNSRAVR
jgi:hypothetical protein